MIEVVFFDIDGTLVQEERCVEQAFKTVGEEACQRYNITPEDFHHTIRQAAREVWQLGPYFSWCDSMGMSSHESLASDFPGDLPELRAMRHWVKQYQIEAFTECLEAFGVVDKALVKDMAQRYPVIRRSYHQLYPEIVPMLEQLAPDYRMAVLSNGQLDVQGSKIQSTGIAQYFEHVTISSAVNSGKPDQGIFAAACAAMGVEPARSAMVGDRLKKDIHGARLFGMKSVWINRRDEVAPPDVQPDAEVLCLAQLGDALDQISQQV